MSAPRFYDELRPPASSHFATAAALVLLRHYRGRVPTVDSLRRHYAMSTATAHRWRNAYAALLGQSVGRARVDAAKLAALPLAQRFGTTERPSYEAMAAALPGRHRSTVHRVRAAWGAVGVAA